MQGLPNCLRALDRIHIPIALPPFKSRREDYRNRKRQYNIIMQAIVRANCCFIYLHVGIPR